jgi:uncharacterized delta-60 repeat protein
MRLPLLLTVFLTVGGISALAQTTDESFHAPLPLRAAEVVDMLPEPNGDIIVGGGIDYVGARPAEPVIRIHADGSYDNSFAFSYTPGYTARRLARAKNGDILALLFQSESDEYYYLDMRLVQINHAGAIVHDISMQDYTSELSVQADGKVLVSASKWDGVTSTYQGTLKRYNTDLTEDVAFSQAVSITGSITAIAVWNDKILVAGDFNRVNGVERNDLVRLNADGSLDDTFDAGAGITYNCIIRALTVLPDGRIVTSGFVDHYDNEYSGSGVVRLNPDGSRDGSFQPYMLRNGSGTTVSTAEGLYVAAFADLADTTQSYLLRLQDNGSLDASFEPLLLDPGGDMTMSVAVMEGHLVISKMIRAGNGFGLAKISHTGEQDDTYQPEIARVGTVRTAAFKEGKIMVVGDFVRIGGFDSYGIARLESDGAVDKTFQLKEHRGTGRQIALQDNGNMLLLMDNDFMQLDSSGDLVPTFHRKRGTQDLYQIKKFRVLPNGKIMAVDANVLARLNANGTHDFSFSPPTLDVRSTAVDFDMQGDNVIYGSTFRTVNGIEVNQVARITPEAAVDRTFSVGRGPESGGENMWASVYMVKVLDDQSILVGGAMDTFDGVFIRQGLLKLSPDGKVDPVFAANQYNARPMEAWRVLFDPVTEQVGSRVFILGGNELYVVNTDGTTDAGFELPAVVKKISGFIALRDTPVNGRTADDENTSLLLFGTFDTADGTVPLLKINVPPPVIMGTTPAADNGVSVSLYPQPASTTLNLHMTGERGRYTTRVYDMTGQARLQTNFYHDTQDEAIDISQLAAGPYVLQVTSPSGKIGNVKFVRAR